MKGKTKADLMQEIERLQGRIAKLEAMGGAPEKGEQMVGDWQYRAIAQTSLDGFWINDMEGRFLDVNEAYCRMTGYSREELLRMRIPDVEALEKPEETARRMRRVLEQGYDRFGTRHRRKDGAILDIEASASYSDAGGGQYVVFLRDITEQKRAEEELHGANQQLAASNQQLRATEQQLRASNQQLEAGLGRLAEAQTIAHLGSWEWDPVKDVISGSDEFYRLFGVSPDQMRTYQSFLDLLSADDREHVGRDVQESLTKKTLYDTEYRVRRPDGDYRNIHARGQLFVDDAGKPVRMVGTCLDITERVRAEEQLRYQAGLLSNVSDAIVASDAQYRLTAWNAAAESLYGWKAEEVIGRYGLEITRTEWPGVDADEMRRTIAEMGQWRGEATQVRKDGTRISVEVSTMTLRDPRGQIAGYVSVNHDITGRKRAEEALRGSESRYRAPVQSANDAVITTDIAGNIVGWNRAAELIFGYTEAEIRGHPFAQLVPHEGRDRFLAGMEGMHAGGEGNIIGKTTESEGVRKDGSRFPLELSLSEWETEQGRFHTAILRDISVRKRAEEALRESEERYRVLFEGSTYGILATDIETRRVVDANPSMCRMLGYSLAELLQLGLADLHPKDVLDHLISEMEAMLREGKSLATAIPCLRKDGTMFYADIGGATTISHGRKWLVGFFADVTERKRGEEELHRVNRALRTLSQVSQALVRASDEPSLLESACRILVDQGGYRLAWVGLAEQDDQKTVRPVAHAGYEQGYLENLQIVWADEGRGRGPAGTAIRTARPVIAKDIATDPNFALWRERAMKRGFASSIALPLASENTQPMGALDIYAAEPNAFNVEEIELLTELANDLGYGIEALRMREANRRGHEQLERQLARLESLRTIDTTIAASLDLGLTLNVLLDQVTNQLKVDAADVLLLNPYSQFLEHRAARGFRTEALKHTRLRLGEGYAGQAALMRSPVRIPALSDAPDGLRRAPLLAAEGFAAYYAMPLIAKGKVKGVLEIFHRSPLEPDREWEEFLRNLAGQAALAIDDGELFIDLQRSNLDLTLAYDATIEGWSRALDLRDKETEGHTQRVTEMAESLAHTLGVEGEALAHVRRGALLHDMGKMGVPDAILLKPGPLTEEEWVIMRKHPTYAYEMLSPIAYLKPALDIPYCHHEKWDGTGYPQGLKGEKIPLSARIFAIVDVWDALRSDRPYRPAWPDEKALEHIREQSGKHFDPHVVQQFLWQVTGV